jgi:sRNA-binding protein
MWATPQEVGHAGGALPFQVGAGDLKGAACGDVIQQHLVVAHDDQQAAASRVVVEERAQPG